MAAALIFCVGHPTYGGPDSGAHVIQFIGDASAIPSLLVPTAETGIEVLDWPVLAAHQPDVIQVLRALGASSQTSLTGWTALILDLAGLVERITPVVAAAGVDLAVKDNQLTITAADHCVTLDEPDQQVEILFRSAGAWSSQLAAMPADLRLACSVVLPIPLPEYGINYV